MKPFFRKLKELIAGRPSRKETGLDEELRFHLEEEADEFRERGLTREEACRAAHLDLGNVALIHEDTRATWTWVWMEQFGQDLRYALRGMRRDAGFTAFAILIAGLGIGASTTVFGVVNALLLRPLPFHDPTQLFWISNDGPNNEEDATQVDHFVDLRAQNKSFSDIAGYYHYYHEGDYELTGTREPVRLSGVPVTQKFFQVLGVSPALGRDFNDDESRQPVDSPTAVILTNHFWRQYFSADPNVLGRTLRLNNSQATVVGIMPANFDFAGVFAPATSIDIFVPWPLTNETNRWGNTMNVVGRLAPGATGRSAQSEFTLLGKRLSEQHITERNPISPHVEPLAHHISGPVSSALIVLACAIGVVMLIVCANLSNLQLARMSARQREIAVRAALGAGRVRLVRQMFTENVALSSCGAALGLVLAYAGTRALSRLHAFNLPLLASVRLDVPALAFTIGCAVFTGILFGLLPGIQAPAFASQESLKEAGRGSAGSRRAYLRSALVVSEIALACALLVGAGLLIRSFIHVLDINLGFEPERAAALRVDPSYDFTGYPQENTYVDEMLRRTRGIPGILSAALTNTLPFTTESSWSVYGKGQTYPRGQKPEAFIRVVSEGYFEAMGVRLVAGRAFTAADRFDSEKVAIINETFARTLWPGQDPVGRMLNQDGGRRVVGVVADVRHVALESQSGNEMYMPIRQNSNYLPMDLVVRTALPPQALVASIRDALRTLDPNLPVTEFATLQTFVDKANSPRRFLVTLITGFAAFALLLACLGIYALISYTVNQRVREIGIRMALGASASNVRSNILLGTLTLAATGLALGLILSRILSVALGSLLYNVTPSDPLTFIVTSALLFAVAAAAGYIPARRAMHVDPIVALRHE
jgi:predicted permease